MSDVTIQIGHFIERTPRELRRCPGYYAADYEVHRTKLGKFPLRLVFVGGYTMPMPYWLVYAIDSDVIDGKVHSGFGGVNYSARDVPRGPSKFPVQTHFFALRDMIAAGHVELLPGMEWVLQLEDYAHPPKTWDELRALASAA